MTTTTTVPAHTDAPTGTLDQLDGYERPQATYLAWLVEAMREHGRKRRDAMRRWSERDAQIKAKYTDSIALRLAKRDDTTLSDIWSEYTFHRDEGMALAAEIQAECAALATMRPRRPR